jgi:translation elongation factor aEF-1 beta
LQTLTSAGSADSRDPEVGFMGDVILVYKILPAEPDKFDSLKAGLEKLNPKRLEEEPIGFGLKVLKFTTMVPDEGGKQEELEEKINAIDGVGEVELEHFSRSM